MGDYANRKVKNKSQGLNSAVIQQLIEVGMADIKDIRLILVGRQAVAPNDPGSPGSVGVHPTKKQNETNWRSPAEGSRVVQGT
jgi:hypothetical protein